MIWIELVVIIFLGMLLLGLAYQLSVAEEKAKKLEKENEEIRDKKFYDLVDDFKNSVYEAIKTESKITARTIKPIIEDPTGRQAEKIAKEALSDIPVIKRQDWIEPKPTNPFCACGCGKEVTKKTNKYIKGHNQKRPKKLTKKQMKEALKKARQRREQELEEAALEELQDSEVRELGE